MSSAHILPDYSSDFPSMPSMPTLRVGGDVNALGRIDHYDLLRKLGGGGFGVVYLAHDTASGVEVALKTLHPLLKSNAEEMDVLREKFRLVSRLSHPNIAGALVLHPVRDVNIWDETARAEMRLSPGDSVMVMRYAPGVTLSKWRRQFPDGIVPLDQALDIARQIASALDYAHGERIVHRDIKPANIMVETLTTDGGEPPNPRLRVRILDFGLAAEIRSSMSRVSTEQGDTSGTRPYMAPEQWLGKKQDGRTDQYALACVLYELLSGAPPFAGVFETGDPAIMIAAVKGEAPDEIEDMPAHVNTALLRALAKAPKERFPICAAFVEEISGGARSPSEPPTPNRERHEWRESGALSSQFAADLEADVLRRKVALSRTMASITDDERKDAEYKAFILEADIGMAAAEEAVRLGRFTAAAQCLARADSALDHLQSAKVKRKENVERAAREEEERREIERATREQAEREEAKHRQPGGRMVIQIASGVELAFRWCPATTSDAWKMISGGNDFFLIGSPKTESGRNNDETQHPVRLTKGFWIGETPITQGQWEAVMGTNPSSFLEGKSWLGFGGKTSPMRPVETVSWTMCQNFMKTLNGLRLMKTEDFHFALPTEAQWEYACRAGTTGAYGGTGQLSDMGWFFDNCGNKTEPIAQKQANAWGLQDMHGNVWEWCADWYDKYPVDTVTDPVGPSSGLQRVFRGGSWFSPPSLCRSGIRSRFWPDYRSDTLGLRVVLVSVQ